MTFVLSQLTCLLLHRSATKACQLYTALQVKKLTKVKSHSKRRIIYILSIIWSITDGRGSRAGQRYPIIKVKIHVCSCEAHNYGILSLSRYRCCCRRCCCKRILLRRCTDCIRVLAGSLCEICSHVLFGASWRSVADSGRHADFFESLVRASGQCP